LKAGTRANSGACSEIPYATEQGIILTVQGIPAEQGILPAKTKIGVSSGKDIVAPQIIIGNHYYGPLRI
jgi:hypothetical protein